MGNTYELQEYETVLETGEYEVNGVNIFSRMADCSLQSGNYSDAISLFDEINEEEMNSEDYFKNQLLMKNDLTQAIKIMQTLLSKILILYKDIFYLQSLFENEKIILML